VLASFTPATLTAALAALKAGFETPIDIELISETLLIYLADG